MTQIPWHRNELERLAWASSEAERDEQIALARQLEGQRVERIQYFTLDYSQIERAEDAEVLRLITDQSEWSEPSWRYNHFDSFDFYLQIDTNDQRSFTVGWDPPNDQLEGLWLHEGVRNGEPFGSVAVWDVTATPRWSHLAGTLVTKIECRYRAEPSLGGWRNELLTLTVDEQRIYVFLGDIDSHHSPTPSANNLMVMSAPTALPDWLAN
jgi:hypothetical protein